MEKAEELGATAMEVKAALWAAAISDEDEPERASSAGTYGVSIDMPEHTRSCL